MTLVHKLVSRVAAIGASFYKKEFERFVMACENPTKEQDRVLMGIVEDNRRSDFGKKHDFKGVRNAEDFQTSVPLGDYDSHYPWIEKEIMGISDQLTSLPIERFATTSGTTSACKFIPITSRYVSDYKKATALWSLGALLNHPKIAGRVLTIASSMNEGVTEGGIPYGAVSGLMQKKQIAVAKILGVAGPEISSIKDIGEKNYAIARVALEEDLTHIHTANPLTILNIMRTIDSHAGNLIGEVYDGVSIMGKRKPNKNKARELEKMLSAGNFSPENYWPNLALVGCWTGGTQYLFLEQLRKYFPKTPFRDIGLLASEGRMTIPLKDETPSGVLDISRSFFEFIPEKQMESDCPNVLKAGDLEVNKNYFIILTTGSGLYRYNMGDLVRVTGFFRNTPEVAFLGKGAHVSNVTGEKLTEHQVIGSYKSVRKSRMPDKFILFPRVDDGNARYVIASSFGFDSEDLGALDNSLRASNIEYDSRRKAGKLGPLECIKMREEDFEEVSKRRLIPGKEAQFKHRYIGNLNML